MDANYKFPILMDYIRLETEVRQKAQEYLDDDVSDDNLKSFVESRMEIGIVVQMKMILQTCKHTMRGKKLIVNFVGLEL